MTNEEKAALKERFKAGKIPTELDFSALIDQIGTGSGGILMISADTELRATVMQRIGTTGTQYTIANPYSYTTIPELLDAYSVNTGKDVSNVDQVVIMNECWDSILAQPENELTQSWLGDGGNTDSGIYIDEYGNSQGDYTVYSSYSAHIDGNGFEGTEYPLYIKTDHTTYLLRADVGYSEYSDDHRWYYPVGDDGNYNDPEFAPVEDYRIDAIPRGHACMFVRRTRTVTGYWDGEEVIDPYWNNPSITTSYFTKTFHYWVPVNRSTTMTTYELGQMYQDFEAGGGSQSSS